VLARELTKLHEEFIRGTAAQVLRRVQEHELKGEMTLLIGKGPAQESQSPVKASRNVWRKLSRATAR